MTEVIDKDGRSIKVKEDRPKESGLIPHFTRDQMRNKLRGVDGRHKVLFEFLWRTGVRVSEAVNVQKKDVDLENDEIVIKWLKSNKYEYRKIPVHSSLHNLLSMYVGQFKYDDYLFDLSRQRVYQLAKKYGFSNPHKIRHSFAVNFLRQSDRPMAIVELKQLLGHARVQSTMEYLKVVPMNQKKALEQIKFD